MLTIIFCLVVFGLWMSSAICLSLPRLNSKVKAFQSWLKKYLLIPPSVFIVYIILFSFVAAGEKIMKDLRVGAPFEPTYIYKLTLIKSSLSEKVSIMKTGLILIKSGFCLGPVLWGCPVVHIYNNYYKSIVHVIFGSNYHQQFTSWSTLNNYRHLCLAHPRTRPSCSISFCICLHIH